MGAAEDREDSSILNRPFDSSYKAHAIGGVAITAISQTLKLIVQFASVVILGRLLTPDAFGVFAMVTPIIAFVAMLQDIGLSQAVVVTREISQRQLSTIFWINVALSAVIALLLAAVAPVVGWFYGEARATSLTLAFAAILVFGSFSTQHFALMSRLMRFKALAVIETATTLAGFGVAVAVAWVYPSPWALFASVVATNAVSLLLAWTLIGWRPGRPGTLGEVRELLHFGGGMTAFNIANFFSRNLDNILVGRFAGSVQLGLYDRAYKLLLFPIQQVTGPVTRVMVPVLSRLAGDDGRYRSAYLRAVQQIMLITVPGALFLVMTADRFIPLLMGPEWMAAVPIFLWLGVSALHQPLSSTTGWLFISQGRTGEFARMGMLVAGINVVSFTIGLKWGAVGVAAAYAISDILLKLPLIWWYVGRRGPVGAADLTRIAIPFLVAGGLTALALATLPRGAPGAPLVELGISLAASYLLCWGLIACFPSGRTVLRDSVGMLLALRRRPEASVSAS